MADGAGKTQGHAQPAAACRAAEPGSGHAKAGPAGRKEDAIAAERERVPRRRREAVPADGRIARRGREHADDGRAVGTDVQENRRDREVGEALEGESERIVTREISKPGRPTQRGTAGTTTMAGWAPGRSPIGAMRLPRQAPNERRSGSLVRERHCLPRGGTPRKRTLLVVWIV